MTTKLLSLTTIACLIILSTFICHADTYEYDVKLPNYLIENESTTSVICSIESKRLNKSVEYKQNLLELVLENFKINSGLDKFKFALGKENILELTLPEPNIDLKNAFIKKEASEVDNIQNIINKSQPSLKRRIQNEAELVGYEIVRTWGLLNGNIPESPFDTISVLDSTFVNIVFHKFESVRLPVEYSRGLINHKNEQMPSDKINIEYQAVDGYHLPKRITIFHFLSSRDKNNQSPWYDIKFYNCQIK